MLLLLASLLSARALAAEPTLTVGPVVVVPTNTTLPTEGLSVATCSAAGVPSAEARSGTLVFEVRLRRGRVSVVSVMRSDIGLTAYEECLQRVLADFTWPVRRADVRVPVTVEVVEAGTAPTAGGAGTEGAGTEGAGTGGTEGAGTEGAGIDRAGTEGAGTGGAEGAGTEGAAPASVPARVPGP